MNLVLHRILLVVLCIAAAVVGFWSHVAPRHWYDTFPGLGMRWLPALGPFNEHFVKDGGAMYLGLLLVTAAAVRFADDRRLVMLTAGAWTVFNALHVYYHFTMLHMVPRTVDKVLGVGTLVVLLVVSLSLFTRPRYVDDGAEPSALRR